MLAPNGVKATTSHRGQQASLFSAARLTLSRLALSRLTLSRFSRSLLTLSLVCAPLISSPSTLFATPAGVRVLATVPVLLAAPNVFQVKGSAPAPGADSALGPGFSASVQQIFGEAGKLEAIPNLQSVPAGAPAGSLYLMEATRPVDVRAANFHALACFVGNDAAAQVLLIRKDLAGKVSNGARLASKTIPSSATSAVDGNLLRPLGLSLDALKKVEVGKGLDVLLALKNGQVELGMISEQELSQANKVAPQLLAGVEVAGLSQPPALILAMTSADANGEKLTQVLSLVAKLRALPPTAAGQWYPMSMGADSSMAGKQP